MTRRCHQANGMSCKAAMRSVQEQAQWQGQGQPAPVGQLAKCQKGICIQSVDNRAGSVGLRLGFSCQFVRLLFCANSLLGHLKCTAKLREKANRLSLNVQLIKMALVLMPQPAGGLKPDIFAYVCTSVWAAGIFYLPNGFLFVHHLCILQLQHWQFLAHVACRMTRFMHI